MSDAPTSKRIALHVTADAERSIRFRHPWLYEESIEKQNREGKAGDLAVLYDSRDRFLAIGLYDPASPIRVRILQWHKPATIDQAWFLQRFREALALREPLFKQENTTGFRIVHGENDALPGLIIDRYEDTCVIKLYTSAWLAHLPAVLGAFKEAFPAKRIVLRLSRAVESDSLEDPRLGDGTVLFGPALKGPVIFQENGLFFEADPVHGHKTGFFLDQRDNRSEVGRLSGGKAVLDLFAYTGAFAAYAAKGRARSVMSVEQSKPALDAAERTIKLNQKKQTIPVIAHEAITGDVFDVMPRLAKDKRRFGMVIIDPPSFASAQGQVNAAQSVYARLVRFGLPLVEEGGVFVMSSCSGHVTAELFFQTVLQAAGGVGVNLHEIKRTAHPVDHPIRFPEGAYLKCLFATVEHADVKRKTARPRSFKPGARHAK